MWAWSAGPPERPGEVTRTQVESDAEGRVVQSSPAQMTLTTGPSFLLRSRDDPTAVRKELRAAPAYLCLAHPEGCWSARRYGSVCYLYLLCRLSAESSRAVCETVPRRYRSETFGFSVLQNPTVRNED